MTKQNGLKQAQSIKNRQTFSNSDVYIYKQKDILVERKTGRQTTISTIIRQLSDKYETTVRQVSDKYETTIRQVSDKYQTTVRQVSDKYQTIM